MKNTPDDFRSDIAISFFSIGAIVSMAVGSCSSLPHIVPGEGNPYSPIILFLAAIAFLLSLIAIGIGTIVKLLRRK